MRQRCVVPLIAILTVFLAAVPAYTQATGTSSCHGTFQVLNSDRIGSLKLPAGPYMIATEGGVGCAQAATLFNRFLQDWDGVLPNRWKVSRSGFRQGAGPAAFTVTPTKAPPIGPQAGGPICPGAFTLTLNDRILGLKLPAGNYAVQLLSASSSLSCATAYRDFSVFLRGNYTTPLPSPWQLTAATGTFSRGNGVGFRRHQRRRLDRRRRPDRRLHLPADLPGRPWHPHRLAEGAQRPLLPLRAR